jgi:hypothetical protein
VLQRTSRHDHAFVDHDACASSPDRTGVQ